MASNVWGVLRVDKLLWTGQETAREASLLGDATKRAVEVNLPCLYAC